MGQAPKNKLYFIGIGGCGMAPLATIAVDLGFQVSGSDIADMSEHVALEGLIQRGIQVYNEHNPSQIPLDSTVVYSSAIKPTNLEFSWAKSQNLSLIHRSELLQEFATTKKAITVTGSHGKTTTTAMIAHLLEGFSLQPSVYCGGEPPAPLKAGYIGNGEYFVIEADESDRSFLNYRPFINVITDIGADHMDEYGTLADICTAFATYSNQTHPMGANIFNWDNPLFHDLIDRTSNSELITFGKRIGSDVRLLGYEILGSSTAYDVMIGTIRIQGICNVMGEHNLKNLLATLAVAKFLQLDLSKATKVMESFSSVKRRLSLVYHSHDLKIYDDYAHNPEKIKACIAALRKAWPSHQVHVIFQPHRHRRTELLYGEFSKAFSDADLVYVLPVYAAGEITTTPVDPIDFAKDIALDSHCRAVGLQDSKELLKYVDRSLGEQTNKMTIVSVGAGDVYKFAYQIKNRLESKSQ